MQYFIRSGICLAVLVLGPLYADEIHYTCSDNSKLRVTFSGGASGPGTAHLTFARSSTQITLLQALSADGGRYEKDGTEFWIKGRTARLTQAGMPTRSCHVE